MAITRTSQCHNGEWFKPETRETNGWEAFESLISFHLGWGGQIVEITEEKLVVRTQVMATTDVDTFTGSKEEMLPIITVAGCYLMTIKEGAKKLAGNAADQLMVMSGGNGIKPLFARMIGGFLTGNPTTKIALIGAMNVEDQAFAAQLAKLPIEELAVYAHTALETGLSAQEVLAQFN